MYELDEDQGEQFETIHVYLLQEEAYQVAATIIDQAPTPTKQPPTALGVLVCLLGLVLTLGSLTFSLLLAFNPGLLPPTIDKQIDKTMTLTFSLHPTAIQVQSYLLPEIRATKQQEVPATGIVHRSASRYSTGNPNNTANLRNSERQCAQYAHWRSRQYSCTRHQSTVLRCFSLGTKHLSLFRRQRGAGYYGSNQE